MQDVLITIDGMTCGHCVAAVQRTLNSLAGVERADVKIGQATVRFDPATASLEQLTDAVEDEGYAVVGAK